MSGEEVNFTCGTTQPVYPNNSFVLYRAEIPLSSKPRDRSWEYGVTFTITVSSSGSEDYCCVQMSPVSGRNASSEKSEPVNITVVVLPTPRIVVDFTTVVRGADVTLNCESWQKISVKTFYFYHNEGLIYSAPKSTAAWGNSATFTIKNMDDNKSGSYNCTYEVEKNGRRLTSAWSNSVHLSATDLLLKPLLRVDRVDKVYLRKEKVTFTCSVNCVSGGLHFFLYRAQTSAEIERIYSGDVCRVNAVVKERSIGSEEYFCYYTKNISGKMIQSDRSEEVTITTLAEPEAPKISHGRPIGLFSKTETVSLTCEANRIIPNQFYFRKRGLRLSSEQITVKGNTGMFTVTTKNQSGPYTCQYTTNVQSRLLDSLPSKQVDIFVADLAPPTLSADLSDAASEDITFICTSPLHLPAMTFFLHRHGDSRHLQDRQTGNNSVKFTIPNTDINKGRRYTCHFEVHETKGLILSALSNVLDIPPRDKSFGVQIGIRMVAFLIVSILMMGIVYWKKDVLFQQREKKYDQRAIAVSTVDQDATYAEVRL
ncbi:immunoglobulin superfamily member 1-like isoform X2 [Pristis pectinata]|nr:immunoglobulin superfamily member 1-like isoform X2 [Pristis pectinata]